MPIPRKLRRDDEYYFIRIVLKRRGDKWEGRDKTKEHRQQTGIPYIELTLNYALTTSAMRADSANKIPMMIVAPKSTRSRPRRVWWTAEKLSPKAPPAPPVDCCKRIAMIKNTDNTICTYGKMEDIVVITGKSVASPPVFCKRAGKRLQNTDCRPEKASGYRRETPDYRISKISRRFLLPFFFLWPDCWL